MEVQKPLSDEKTKFELNSTLLSSAGVATASLVKSLLDKGAEAFYQRQSDGVSPLMLAAEEGNDAVVELLLASGAPWNALDKQGRCAGEYAMKNNHQSTVDMLVDAGVRAELLLGAVLKQETILNARSVEVTDSKDSSMTKNYLKEDGIEYSKDGKVLLDEQGDAVMMEWERPLMELHAKVVCQGSDVLNVGFGMGIIDSEIEKLKPKSHTIIEAHPKVYEKMLQEGWDKKPRVKILFGRWQDVLLSNNFAKPEFDGIFFDTYGEYYEDLREFHSLLPRILRPGGIYSFFNGLCPRNLFFHGVCCQIVTLELNKLGFDVHFEPIEIDKVVNSAETWKNVQRRYWFQDTYYIPVALLKNT